VILGVAIATPLRRLFDYRPPPGADELRPGQRVWVPFGRRKVVGVILELRERSELPAAKLRAVLSIIDREPTFDTGLLKLLAWSADYYRHPIGDVISAALPAALRDGASLRDDLTRWRLTELGRHEALEKLAPRAARLRAVVTFLSEREDAPTLELLAGAEIERSALHKLVERGYLEQIQSEPRDGASGLVSVAAGPTLNEGQRAALSRIQSSLGTFATHLLYGVTGSGKTEVYLNAIAQVLARGEQALVLVPEIALTPQLIGRFRARFDSPPAVLHSALNDTERLQAWRSAREGHARIVIGTRSAIFCPLFKPGLIVVDEEHDGSYKQQEGFRYSARDLAIVRAQRCAIPVVLGSATPSLESLHRAQRAPEFLSRLTERAANAKPPRVALIDLRSNATTQGIATPAVQAIRRHLDERGQVMLFLNRRGYAPVLFCSSCGWSAHCRRCDAHMTVHARTRSLICHHCGSEDRIQEVCPNCGAPSKPVGQGTERIEEAIGSLFPDAEMARIDRDSMRRKGELEATLARVERGEVRILVGTQMLTKGHDFPNVTLVVVLNADQGLFSADFRAPERLAQTIVQVSGRAGRAERAGEVLIQTEYPDHPLLKLLLEGGYEAFARGALDEREQCAWPPFARIALLRAEASQQGTAMSFLQSARDLARDVSVPSVGLLGPAPASMEKRAGRYRAQLLVTAPTHGPLQKFLARWLPGVESLPAARRVRWSIDVDANELF
jgi:primosomal protein N' (replication factor Y)